ncbi:MAG TPA: metal ABC transporter permease [Patescibacteria group bacterium]|jgi:zinc transport system permease protein|nr:metal ABC transporter permease [Patescibacteria group bacterium]
MFNIFQYGFILRGIEVGLIIGAISPLIGIFLVLRRYSLIADTLSHVSLAGVAVGLLLNVNPLLTAIGVSVLSSFAIEKLRLSKKVYGESALSIFLSGSLAIALIILSLAHGFSVDLFNYLFGSILTVKQSDVYIILGVGIVVLISVLLLYKELIYITFDEEAARVGGIPTKFINNIFIVLAALTVALAIPIVGILLISALIVIPVVAALQLKKSFWKTLILAEVFSIISVFMGILASFYLNLPAGGAIVLTTLIIFVLTLFWQKAK